jgi:hypothetical protein
LVFKPNRQTHSKSFQSDGFQQPESYAGPRKLCLWAVRRGDLQIVPHVLTGTPISTGIAAHLLTIVGRNKTNSFQDNIEFEICFLKYVLEFSKAQDVIHRQGMREIEKYYDLKTDSKKIKPAPMQTEEE